MEKVLYKIEILILKIIPYILALFYFILSILNVYGIFFPMFATIAQLSLIPWGFLLLSSYVFKFCVYHRIPLYYIASNEIFNLIDYHWLYGLTDNTILIINIVLFGLFTIICGLLKLKLKW